jgi:hypothetical protein
MSRESLNSSFITSKVDSGTVYEDIHRESKQLVRLWPKNYPLVQTQQDDKEEKVFGCYLFIGLFFGLEKRNESMSSASHANTTSPTSSLTGESPGPTKINLDLTKPIKNFVTDVNNTARSSNGLHEGMKIKVDYVKRKQLLQYLPENEKEKLSQKLAKRTSTKSHLVACEQVKKRPNDGNEENHGNAKRINTDITNESSDNIADDAKETSIPSVSAIVKIAESPIRNEIHKGEHISKPMNMQISASSLLPSAA